MHHRCWAEHLSTDLGSMNILQRLNEQPWQLPRILEESHDAEHYCCCFWLSYTVGLGAILDSSTAVAMGFFHMIASPQIKWYR
jgi:hypothetical protein